MGFEQPRILTGVENENVVDNALFAVAFSAAKNNQVLPELRARMAISGRWRRAAWRIRVDLSSFKSG
jgi:TolB-like protein